jgi:flagellar FliL protein
MSEETDRDTDAAPAKSGRGKLILLIGLPLLLLLGGGAVAVLTGVVPMAGAATDAVAEDALASADVVFVDMPDLLINLNVSGRRLRFLKIATALEVRGEDQAEQVRQLLPRIVDSFHLYLRAISPEELQGAEGAYRIKEELLARTNDAVRPIEVQDVLVRELLVQ